MPSSDAVGLLTLWFIGCPALNDGRTSIGMRCSGKLRVVHSCWIFRNSGGVVTIKRPFFATKRPSGLAARPSKLAGCVTTGHLTANAKYSLSNETIHNTLEPKPVYNVSGTLEYKF